MSTVGGYLEYRGGVQYRGVLIITWGVFSPPTYPHVGGYHEYRGGVQYRGVHDIPTS